MMGEVVEWVGDGGGGFGWVGDGRGGGGGVWVGW